MNEFMANALLVLLAIFPGLSFFLGVQLVLWFDARWARKHGQCPACERQVES